MSPGGTPLEARLGCRLSDCPIYVAAATMTLVEKPRSLYIHVIRVTYHFLHDLVGLLAAADLFYAMQCARRGGVCVPSWC